MIPPDQIVWAICDSVDWEKGYMRCHHVDDEEAVIFKCLLGLGGFRTKPKVGSKVLIASIYNKAAFCVLIHAAEVEEFKFTLADGGVMKLNGDQYGGIPKTPSLVNRLNAIEQDINLLKNTINSWGPAANDGGAKLKSDLTLAGWIPTTLTETTNGDIENPSVKHG